MNATYLLRFDDICPTMNWNVWDRLEGLLFDSGVHPLVAVVPDNRDPVLEVGAPNARFWERIRRWQSWGWTIAAHGYQHRVLTSESGIVGLNRRSEFAGLSAWEQEDKLRSALSIFEREGVEVPVWTAPNHSFDRTTLAMLRAVGIGRINEGLYLYPFVDGSGLMWIPHQVWRFHEMPFGVWTIGCHVNGWTGEDIARLFHDLDRYRARIKDIRTVAALFDQRSRTAWDPSMASLYRWAVRGRLRTRQVLQMTRRLVIQPFASAGND